MSPQLTYQRKHWKEFCVDPRQSSPGLSALRYEPLLALIGPCGDVEGKKVLSPLADFFKRIVNSEAPSGLLKALCASELIAIPKNNDLVFVRLISLVDVFCKIARNCVLHAARSHIDRACGNLQWGAGRKMSMDIRYHSIKLATLSDKSRDLIIIADKTTPAESKTIYLRQSRKLMSHMLPFLLAVYSEKSSSWLYDASASELREIVISTGVRQGDPLGPALYALSDIVLLRMKAEGIHLHGFIAAYLDDEIAHVDYEKGKEYLTCCLEEG